MTLSSLFTYWFISLVVFDFNDIATADLLSPLLQATAILFLSGITLSHVIVWLALAQTYHVSPGQQHLEAVSDFFSNTADTVAWPGTARLQQDSYSGSPHWHALL